jgi:tyrosine-protein phosphatase YwqE
MVKKEIKIDLQAAAEYYLDEALIEKLDKNEPLLTFGHNYLLFETAFMNEPVFLKDAIFKMNTNGYKPVLAHPERYLYLIRKPSLVEEIQKMGVFLQLNILSLKDYYSREVRRFAEKLIKTNSIHFIGSDCHNMRQFDSFKLALESRELARLNNLKFFNDQLK